MTDVNDDKMRINVSAKQSDRIVGYVHKMRCGVGEGGRRGGEGVSPCDANDAGCTSGGPSQRVGDVDHRLTRTRRLMAKGNNRLQRLVLEGLTSRRTNTPSPPLLSHTIATTPQHSEGADEPQQGQLQQTSRETHRQHESEPISLKALPTVHGGGVATSASETVEHVPVATR